MNAKIILLLSMVFLGFSGCSGDPFKDTTNPSSPLHAAPDSPDRIFLSSSFHNAEIGLNSPHTTIDWSISLEGSITMDNSGNYNKPGNSSVSGTGIGGYNFNGTYLLLKDGTLSFYSPDFNPLAGGITSATSTNDIFVYAGVSDLSDQRIGVGVVKGNNGYTTASLNGDYFFATLTRGYKWNVTEEGKIHFDGAGNYTISGYYSESGVGVSLPLSYNGTYLVHTDGTFSYSTPRPATFSGGISGTGEVLVFSNVSDPDRQGFGIAVKAGSDNFSNATLITTYRFVEILDGNADSPYPYADTPVPYTTARVGTIRFDGVNSFGTSGTYSKYPDGINLAFAYTGQYQLSADGSFSLTTTDPFTLNGGISASGNVFIYSNVSSSTVKSIGIGIKK